MWQEFPKRKYFFTFIVLALCSVIAIYWITKEVLRKQKETMVLELKSANELAAHEFKEALNTYATLITGIKGYIELNDSVPHKEEVKSFLYNQLDDLSLLPPFNISYVDTNHIIVFDFTNEIVPSMSLEGASMTDIIGKEGVKRMDRLMHSEDFYASDPTNLLEGRVGFPLGFGVLDSEDKSIGYITSVAEFKPIMDRVYTYINSKDFVYKFMSQDGVYFDRTRSYNNQKVYAKERDREYFKNFDIPEEAYIFTNVPFYNKIFTISTAFKKQKQYSLGLLLTSIFWYVLVLGFLLFVISQLYLYKRKNAIIAAQKEQLTELVATKNKFFSIIAHDLRSPLSSVINFLDMLKVGETDIHTNKEIVKDLGESSKNSLSLLDNLLKWSKVQTGNLKFNPVSINILKIIKDQIRVQKYNADKKGIKVIVESNFNGNSRGDKNMVGTIIRNLLSNAIKFSHADSVIAVEIHKEGDTIGINIEDSGIGIPEKKLSKLFDVTEMTVQLGTVNEKGSGLGLILCKQFVEIHNGKLVVESVEGEGTVASFTLPI